MEDKKMERPHDRKPQLEASSSISYFISMAFKYLFGPVPSRRLGISLGIDLVPHKTCMLDCVYCECGATTQKTLERKEYVPAKKVMEEIDIFLKANPTLDCITFSGSGEPTLHRDIGQIATYIKTRHPAYKLALLTNGTLLKNAVVREEMRIFDLIKVSLDAVSQTIYEKINRPMENMKASDLVTAYIELRKEFKGQIWLEIFFVPGINDTPSELALFKEAILRIKPDKTQLNSLDRPPAEPWVKAEDYSRLQEIADILSIAEVVAPKPLARSPQRKEDMDIPGKITALIKRRPCTLEDISQTLGMPVHQVTEQVSQMELDGKVRRQVQARGIFFILNSADG